MISLLSLKPQALLTSDERNLKKNKEINVHLFASAVEKQIGFCTMMLYVQMYFLNKGVFTTLRLEMVSAGWVLPFTSKEAAIVFVTLIICCLNIRYRAASSLIKAASTCEVSLRKPGDLLILLSLSCMHGCWKN